MKNFKKLFKNKILLAMIVFLFMLVGGLSFYYRYSNGIDKILKTSDYSYLSTEAKAYIKDVYEETGEIILTEKNKEENKPYLNPKYVEYLGLDKKDKENISLIPDSFVMDYSINQEYASFDLPSKYDARNVNGYNFVSPIKNQGSTSLCWAFTSIENIETLYMKNNNQSYSDLVPNFSVRQMDYITSTKYDSSSSHSYLAITGSWGSGMCKNSSCSWTGWVNPDNGSHELSKGGNFYASSIAMANAITLTDESIMPWHEENDPVYVKDIYGFDKTLYEVNSTINMPSINSDTASKELINSYVSEIKTYIMQYGSAFVGTYSPKSTCGFENINGTKVLKTDDCVNNTANNDLGHAMQIIGWDDNYEYSYCDAGLNHYAINSDGTCSKGELTTGKGAWIMKNSWGTDTEDSRSYSYVYLTYDSTRLSIGFVTSMSDMKTRTWDNNYHGNPWIERKISSGLLGVESQTKEFNTHNNNAEKIEKIKFLAFAKNGKYNISILTSDKHYNNIGSVESDEVGIYTIDLSDKNIIINDKIFSVKIEGENGVYFVNDSISVFTSNTSDAPSLETIYGSGFKTYEDSDAPPSEENVAFITFPRDGTIKIEHFLKNISDYKKIKYKALLDGVDYSHYFFYDYNIISSEMVYLDGHLTSTLTISKEKYSDRALCGKVYTFQILYEDEVIESFPVKRICYAWNSNNTKYTTSKISFHKNDGSSYFSTRTESDTYTLKFLNSNGSGNYSLPNEKEFFKYDRYIKSWNTKADGTGITYTDNDYFVYKDMELYAQWSDPKTEPHRYNIQFGCNYGICEERNSLYKKDTVTFNKLYTIPKNTFTNLTEGQEFIYWAFDSDDDIYYYEEEKVMNISEYGFTSPYNLDETEYLEAVWSDSYNVVSFDANGGSGTMKDIKIIKDKTSRLKYNLFTRTGYSFKGWNTKVDGTGTSYTDAQRISITEDIILYAQWEENKIKITFNANNGTNNILEQSVPELADTKLLKNSFTKIGHNFSKWNTKADGTGTSFTDEQVINISEDLVLYAQWIPQTYELVFNSNGGTGIMNKQTYTYNVASSLLDVKFTKDGYVFKEWNTKSDGTGVSYTNKQSIKIYSNMTLYAIWEEGPGYIINKYTYDDKYIYLDSPNTSLSDFENNVVLNTGYVLKFDLDGKNKIFTGSKVQIYRDNTLIAEYINIIKGDVTADGIVNIADIIKIADDILGLNTLKENYEEIAAEVTSDNIINIADVVKIADYTLNNSVKL